MYNPEITKLVNENFTLDSTAAALIKNFVETSNCASLDRADQIQDQIFENRKKITELRGE